MDTLLFPNLQILGEIVEKIVVQLLGYALQKVGIDAVLVQNFIDMGTRTTYQHGKFSHTDALCFKNLLYSVSDMHIPPDSRAYSLFHLSGNVISRHKKRGLIPSTTFQRYRQTPCTCMRE